MKNAKDIRDILMFEGRKYFDIKEDILIINLLEKKAILPITM